MNLFKVLLRPDREEAQNPDRALVIHAANLLQIGEFQLLQLGYRHWHGQDMPDSLVDGVFADYMLRNRVPLWARHYARTIARLAERGELDDQDPNYHRYDREQYTNIPQGMRSFVVLTSLVIGFMGGIIVLAHVAAGGSLSVLPPYFETEEVQGARPAPIEPMDRMEPWQRR